MYGSAFRYHINQRGCKLEPVDHGWLADWHGRLLCSAQQRSLPVYGGDFRFHGPAGLVVMTRRHRHGVLLFATPTKVVGEPCHQLFWHHIKCLTNPKEGVDRDRASRLDHLPVTNGESIGNHVLLGQVSVHPVGPNAVPQRPKVPSVMGREISAGTHPFKLAA